MLTPDEVREIRSLIDLNDIAIRQTNPAMILALIDAAYYLGHSDGQNAGREVTRTPRVSPERGGINQREG